MARMRRPRTRRSARAFFDEIMPELGKAARLPHDWWTIDLCFWPDAWAATETCKKALDGLIEKYG